MERIKAARDEEEDEIGSVNDLDTSSFMVLDAVGSGDGRHNYVKFLF